MHNREYIEEIINLIYPHQIIQSQGDTIPNKIRIYGADGIDYIENITKTERGYSYTIHRFLDAKVFKDWLLNYKKLYKEIKNHLK